MENIFDTLKQRAARLQAEVDSLEGYDGRAEAQANIDKYIANPNRHNLSNRNQVNVFANAKQYGLDTSKAEKLARASVNEQLQAGGLGFIDALVMGLLPDKLMPEWYRKPSTTRAKNSGKILGTLASIALPEKYLLGRLFSSRSFGVGTAKAIGNLGKIGSVANRADNAGDIAAAKQLVAAAKLENNIAKTATTAQELKEAKKLLTAAKAAGSTVSFGEGVAKAATVMKLPASTYVKAAARIIPTVPKAFEAGYGPEKKAPYLDKNVNRYIGEWKALQQQQRLLNQ